MEIRISKVANGFTVERIGRNNVYGHPENLNVAESFESMIRILADMCGLQKQAAPIISDSFSPAPIIAHARAAEAYESAGHFTDADRDVSISLNQIRENQNA